MNPKFSSDDILKRLDQQKESFEKLLKYQKGVYLSVKEKNWSKLEENLRNISRISTEIEADSLFFNEITGGSNYKIKDLVENCSMEERKKIIELHGTVKQLALRSKIENDCLNSYVQNMAEFLRGFFEAVVPSKKYYTYNAYGQKVKREVESLVLNKVL